MPWSRRWRIDSREKFERVLRALEAFEADFSRMPCEVIIREELQPLTDRQRGLFHAVCEDAAPHFGMSPGEFKAEVKRQYYGDEDMIDRLIALLRGVQSGKFSTEQLDHEHYGLLIDVAFLICAEAGVVIPDRRAR